MNIEKFIVHAGDNYNYLVCNEKQEEAIAVDPLEVDTLIALAKEKGVVIVAILITHGHEDHTGGAGELANKVGAKIYGHNGISCVDVALTHKKKIVLAGLEVEPLVTPGHTFDSICYLISGNLFTGDTIFFSGAGNCYSGDVDMLYESFRDVLVPLPDTTKLQVGHEYAKRNLEFAQSIEPENIAITKRLAEVATQTMPETTIGQERLYNPFFRFTNEAYLEALETHVGNIITDQKEVFLITRELRNRW